MATKKTTGTKEWRPNQKVWAGRVHIDGKRTGWKSLGTDDADVADERMALWAKTGEPPSEAGKETFASASERIVDRQEVKKEKGAKERRHRLRTFALPVIGHIEIAELKANHVFSVLDKMGQQEGATKEQYAADTVHHMRTDISRILTELVREGALSSNVARDVELPDDVETDDRPRVVLHDEEIMRFRRRGFHRELDMMALFARDLGGHRTSDLHAADYGDFDTVDWKTCFVRRPKTSQQGSKKGRRKGRRRATRGYERVRITIPESVLGPLKVWWEKAGKPTTGPVFPIRRGKRVGERKCGKGISYVIPLRDALWDEGIVRPLPGYETAVGEARRQFCALQVDTDETRAVDFHSFRRAFVTALGKSGVNLQTSMLAAGHGDPTTHLRYNVPETVTVPASALPGFTIELAKEEAMAAAAPSASPAEGTARPAPRAMRSLEGTEDHAQDDIRSRPAADPGNDDPMLASVPESPAPLSAAASMEALAAAAPAARGIEEVLAELLVALRAGSLAGAISPSLGLKGLSEADLGQPNPQGFRRRAHQDSNLGPTAPEAAWAVTKAQKLSDGEPPDPTGIGGTEPVPARAAGSEPAPATRLEQLRTLAKGYVDEGKWEQLRALQPLIDAETKTVAARAPISLEAVRAKKEGAQ